ncbi:MAG TPA: hypothetical protein VFV38_35305 [Ktedonobacteraceae bacterium]|nr:hypothetical protein [Ktedonobacteraceae bacterium]
MDLRNAALLVVAQHSHQCDHIETKFPMWQGPSTFFLWSSWLVKTRARDIAALIHLEG